MNITWLADVLRAEGLTVEEHDDWKTRTLKPFYKFTPVGLINHHTAGSAVIPNYPLPPYWSNISLQSKCNLTIRPDGVCVTLNAGVAADSGLGAPQVYDAVKANRALPPLAGLESTMDGTNYYIDIEVQHKGDGSPIVEVQLDALIRSNAAICKKMGWDPAFKLIGHREWAPDRKTDPRWNGNANPMPQIRLDTKSMMEADMPLTAAEKQEIIVGSATLAAKMVWEKTIRRPSGDTPALQELADIKNLLLNPADLAQRIAATGLADAVITEIKKLTYKAV